MRSARFFVNPGAVSAALIALDFLAYTVCYLAVSMAGPSAAWTNLADYIAGLNPQRQVWVNAAQGLMVLFGPLYLVLLNAIYQQVDAQKKALIRTAIDLAIPFVVLSGAFYFIQASAVRIELRQGITAGLEQVIQANPYSAFAAANMLGWTLFFGLSSLFAALAFPMKGLTGVIRMALLVNGAACLLGGVGYVIESFVLVLFCMTFLMGGAVLVASTALALWFQKRVKLPLDSHTM